MSSPRSLQLEKACAQRWRPNAAKNKFLKSASLKKNILGFPGGAVVENLPANAGDTGSSPGLGGSHMPQSN